MYYLGNGITQDRKAAYIWYQKAANQGLRKAVIALKTKYKEVNI